MSDITVYTKPECVQCKMTFKLLDTMGANYTAIDVSADDQAREHVQNLGYLQAPVVYISPDWHWTGFRPEWLRTAAENAA